MIPMILMKSARKTALVKLFYEHSSWVITFKAREFTHAMHLR